MNARVWFCLALAVSQLTHAHAQVQEVWARYIGRNDRPSSVQVDNAGNVYVTGSARRTSLSDFITHKYATDGTGLWETLYNGAATNSLDFGHALAIDESGSVYVLGASDNGQGPMHLTLLKYDPGGNQIWVSRYTVAGNTEPIALLVRSNEIYVAGSSYSTNTGWDYVTLKYDSNGNELWAARYTETGTSQETISGIAFDNAGNVVATGFAYAPGGGKIVTVKYAPDGTAAWTNVTSPGAFYSAREIAVDASGNIYVAGNLGADLGIIKLDANGQQLWLASYGGPNLASDTLISMSLDPSGNVLLTGFSYTAFTHQDYLTVKFDSNGNRLWTARFSGNGDFGQDTPSAISVDNNGNAYVTGYSPRGANFSEFATVKYDPDGNQLWVARYNLGGDYDAAIDLALDAAGNVYVTGLSFDGSTELNIVTLKYRQVAVAGLPQITSPPQGLVVIAGTNATFEVTATGNTTLGYQWRFMGAPLAGQTSRTFVISNVTPSQAGDYSVIVSNSIGVTVSPEARLMVFQPPDIPVAWTNLLVTEGGHVYLPAYATGDPPLFYQWQFNGMDMPGETNSSLLLFNLGTNQAGNYTLVATNSHGRAEKILATIVVRPRDSLDRWYWRHPLPQGNDFRDVTYGDGRFVAVGEQGTILVSTDGLTWTNRTMDWFDLVAVAHGNGTFVAVGPFGGLLTSTDGEHWTKRSIPGASYPGELSDVTFGNGRFVAVGNRSVISSVDGVEWQAWPGAVNHDLATVGFGNGKFVAYRNGVPAGIISSDGVNWSSFALQPALAFGIRSVAFGNGLFVGVTASQIRTSPDGTNWTAQTDLSFHSVTFANGTFLAVGERIARSVDGTNWDLVLPPQTNFLAAATFGDGKFVVVGERGMLLTSSDGIDWTIRGGGTPNNLRGITRAPSGFVAVGNEGTVWSSANGFGWTNRGSITAHNLRAIAYGNETLVAAGEGNPIFTSRDGLVWTSQSAPPGDCYGLHYGNGNFVALGDAGVIRVSSNGVNWVAASSSTTWRLQGVTFGKGLYVATGRNGTILTSSNALAWTPRASPTSVYLESVAASSNLFVAVGQDGVIVVSLDGITWTRRDIGVLWDIESVVYGDGSFVAVGDNGRVLTSDNGGDWLSRFTGCRNTLRKVVYADGAFWCAGNNDTILKSGQIRPHLLASGHEGGEFKLWIEAELGVPHRLQVSSNLVDWIDRINFTPADEATLYSEPQSDDARGFYRVVSP